MAIPRAQRRNASAGGRKRAGKSIKWFKIDCPVDSPNEPSLSVLNLSFSSVSPNQTDEAVCLHGPVLFVIVLVSNPVPDHEDSLEFLVFTSKKCNAYVVTFSVTHNRFVLFFGSWMAFFQWFHSSVKGRPNLDDKGTKVKSTQG